ncbi:hypothetical protein EON65_32795 [archaeon]|nr:MAG: hypothetical protein EON65_32795 [archaeon]
MLFIPSPSTSSPPTSLFSPLNIDARLKMGLAAEPWVLETNSLPPPFALPVVPAPPSAPALLAFFFFREEMTSLIAMAI